MVRKIGRARHVAELRQQARSMSRHAWSLLRMADEIAGQDGDESDGLTPITHSRLAYEHEQLLAALAERELSERTRRRRMFPGSIFGARGWDLVLILYRSRVQGRRIAPSNLAVELECTGREIDSLLDLLREEKLVEWCSQFRFVRLSEEGATRVRDYFIEQPTAILANDLARESKCA